MGCTPAHGHHAHLRVKRALVLRIANVQSGVVAGATEPDDPRGPCLERPPYSLARSIKKDPADTIVSEPSSIFYQKTGKYVHSHGLTGPNRRVRATNSKSVRLGFIDAHAPLPFYNDIRFQLPFEFPGKGMMPQTILLDRQGRIRASLAGDADWNSAEARALIDALLAEGAPAA